MHINTRVSEISESITLKLNAKAVAMSESGTKVFNFTAGQLPHRPPQRFVEGIKTELDFLKSYQYAPVAGYPELRTKVLNHFAKSRGVSLPQGEFDCVISNGGKHALSNVLGTIVDPGDEVIVLSPYWLSYPEIIRFVQGVPVTVEGNFDNHYIPSVKEIDRKISPRTRAIIINSPSNPAGIHYSREWMNDLADLLSKHPEVMVISDEIYFELVHDGSRPSYFYQSNPKLLNQTIVIDGISKSLASTGLRIGWTIAPKALTQAISRLQGQMTSNACSLIQRALIDFDLDSLRTFVKPINHHLQENAQTLLQKLEIKGLSQKSYPTLSAFYYLFDFSNTPVHEKFKKGAGDEADYSAQVAEAMLEQVQVAVVPGGPFGAPNTFRLSLVSEKGPFAEGVERMLEFIVK